MTLSPVHITEHSGKLEGIPAISTSTLGNVFCNEMRRIKNSVCSKCYAHNYELFRRPLFAVLSRNGKLLAGRLLEPEELPVFDVPYVRFQSFGELHNATHLMNLYAIARANEKTTFALWTKRLELVRAAGDPPPNVVLIASERLLGALPSVPTEGFHHTYVVHEGAEPCGKRCLDCLRCYSRETVHFIYQRRH